MEWPRARCAEAICSFCDTEFRGVGGPGGGRFADAAGLAKAVHQRWPRDTDCRPFVVLTGGEPLLQADECLIEALHRRDFEVAIETNGTILPPPGVDWICVSPKAGAPLRLRFGDELKLVYPQSAIDPTEFESLRFDHFLLQPMDGPDLARNTTAAADYCRANPRWSLSLQTHKMIGIP